MAALIKPPIATAHKALVKSDVDTAQSPTYVGTSMRILVIGGGGREHALVWKLHQSRLVEKIWCAPGNGGIGQHAECVPADLTNIPGLAQLAERLRIDLTVVGPEQPLVDGIADEFRRRGLRIIGPSKKWAQLEGSKVFAKEFMNQHGIPTAALHGVFASADGATKKLATSEYPVVLKAEGLCGGKGVLVAKSYSEATDFANRVLSKREFGEGGGRLLLEEALDGKELSVMVLSDGNNFVSLIPARDHKRVLDGDLGPNTGGMGAYTCDGIVPPPVEEQIQRAVIGPTMQALRSNDSAYCGFLYFGLMMTSSGPRVLEFNCRLGDPETQPIVTRMNFDLAEVLRAVAEGKLRTADLNWNAGASVCVVMASGGYPGKYGTGEEVLGLERAAAMPEVVVFHAGTRREGEEYYTCSGRVLGVTGIGDTLELARRRAYDAVSNIRFGNCQYRSDIALTGCRVANTGED